MTFLNLSDRVMESIVHTHRQPLTLAFANFFVLDFVTLLRT